MSAQNLVLANVRLRPDPLIWNISVSEEVRTLSLSFACPLASCLSLQLARVADVCSGFM